MVTVSGRVNLLISVRIALSVSLISDVFSSKSELYIIMKSRAIAVSLPNDVMI